MTRYATRAGRLLPVLLHLAAGSLALLYAWIISGTQYATTGVQFVSPLAVVILIHLAWMAWRLEARPGFATVLLGRALTTAFGIAISVSVLAIYAPMPAVASPSSVSIEAFLLYLSCAIVIALVVGAAALVIYLVAKAVRAGYNALKGPKDPSDGPGQSRLFDAGVVVVSLLAIAMSSLEGTSSALTFSGPEGASSTVVVAAPPARVLQEVGTATSPRFPLPIMLRSIPHPVAVVVDEGAGLGARRIVRFKGREGEGDLVLKVVRQSEGEVVFEAISDTSPISMWVRHKALTFRIEPHGSGSALTVSSQYDRLLSPAWFFRPYIRIAAYLAVDVLARDTAQRAEAR
jgi:hypothetical protein